MAELPIRYESCRWTSARIGRDTEKEDRDRQPEVETRLKVASNFDTEGSHIRCGSGLWYVDGDKFTPLPTLLPILSRHGAQANQPCVISRVPTARPYHSRFARAVEMASETRQMGLPSQAPSLLVCLFGSRLVSIWNFRVPSVAISVNNLPTSRHEDPADMAARRMWTVQKERLPARINIAAT